MKATLLNFFLLIGFLLSAQQRALLNGKLLYRDNNVIAANVINNSTQFNTITDSDGEFQIEVAKGDEIIFSSVEFKFKTIFNGNAGRGIIIDLEYTLLINKLNKSLTSLHTLS